MLKFTLRAAVTCSLIGAITPAAADEPALAPSSGRAEGLPSPSLASPPPAQPDDGQRAEVVPTTTSKPVDRQQKTGRILLIVGGSVFAWSYLLTAVPTAVLFEDHRFALPIVGPFWVAGDWFSGFPSCMDSLGCALASPLAALVGVGVIATGVFQVIGAASLVTGGIVLGTSRPHAPRVSLLPYGTRSEAGMALAGTF